MQIIRRDYSGPSFRILKLKIAIIGGGASGIVTAYLLDSFHQVTLFEKQSILGGNIRTLNKNVKSNNFSFKFPLDNGVIEFARDHSPYLNALMADLKIELEIITGGATSFFSQDGSYWQSPGAISKSSKSLIKKYKNYFKLLSLMPDYLIFWGKMKLFGENILFGKPISNYLQDQLLSRWYKMLLMYGYSTPYLKVNDFPAEMAFETLTKMNLFTYWNRIPGGVYRYVEAILDRIRGKVHCDVKIDNIIRKSNEVSVNLKSGENLKYDKIIFATPPDQILEMLADPTDDEKKRFFEWKGNHISTKIHTDIELYKKYGVKSYNEFDVFEGKDGKEAGYNAYLNRLCSVPSKHSNSYFLSFNLDNYINPEKVIHIQNHHTPLYTPEAIKYRKEVIETNGQNNTYFTGAYLKNGLHEGAISSAFETAKNLL